LQHPVNYFDQDIEPDCEYTRSGQEISHRCFHGSTPVRTDKVFDQPLELTMLCFRDVLPIPNNLSAQAIGVCGGFDLNVGFVVLHIAAPRCLPISWQWTEL
jgi:hypothetical protein